MKLVRYTVNSKTGYGVYDDVLNLIKSNDELFQAVSFEKALEVLKEDIELTKSLRSNQVRFEAPVQPTKNVICIGKNYHDHILEFDGSDKFIEEVKESPIFFTKTISSIVGPDDNIDCSSHVTKELDYEGELGVVMGKECKDVSPEEALTYVFGYTIINDVTARDLQRKHKQWFYGKGLDTFCPVGPYIVTKDEIENPQDLEIVTKVNGEVRQNAKTELMIHNIAKQISFISKGVTLKPGDVLATGTPKGVGMGFKPPKFLKSGDVVEIGISKIGVLINKVK